MSFLIIVTLCNAISGECDRYRMESNLTIAECVAIIRPETMPVWIVETYKLDSFDEVSCEVMK